MRVRITSVTSGEAPLWVREQWIGIILDGEPFDPYISEENPPIEVLTGKPAIQNYAGAILVKSEDAIEALRKSSPDAAIWWDSNYLGAGLVFIKDWFELIDGEA